MKETLSTETNRYSNPWRTTEYIRAETELRHREWAHINTAGLSHTAKRILVILLTEWRWSEGGNHWESISVLSRRINRTSRRVRVALHELQTCGALRYSFAIDPGGMLKGSGYFLQPKWDI